MGSNVEWENFVLDVYYKLFLTNFLQTIPVVKFQQWFVGLFDFLERKVCTLGAGLSHLLNRIIKKSLNFILKEENLASLLDFINIVIYWSCLIFA
jgi:hypothetical protein